MSTSFAKGLSLILLVAGNLLSVTAYAQDEATKTPATAAPVAGVTFDEAIRRALERNPSVELAQQEIRRSEALVKQARAAWLPSVQSGATYSRIDADRMFGDRVLQDADSFNVSLSASVPVIAPQAWVASARASEGVDLARLTQEDARRQIALAAARAFLTVVGQRRVLESAERALAAARTHEEYARARLAGDVGNQVDVVRAAQERARSELRVQNQRIGLVRAQEALGVILGDDGPVDAAQITLPRPPPLETALDEAEAQRADVRVARERVEINRRARRDTYADFLPTLTASGQVYYQTPESPTVPTTGWQVQLVFSLPLYNGGYRFGRARERAALEEQSRISLAAALRQARSEVRVAFEAMRRADDAVVHARENAALAREALELVEQAYRSGARTNLEVIDAQRQAADSETDLEIAEDAARQARLDLLAAAGRFPTL